MKTTLVATLLLASLSSYASSIYGTYQGVTHTRLGFERDCTLEITDMVSPDVHFEVKVEKGIINPQMQRLMSIKGPKSHYLSQLDKGSFEVKLGLESQNWNYVLPHHDTEDFGTTTIQLDNNNSPTEFTIVRRSYEKSFEITCENLKKL